MGGWDNFFFSSHHRLRSCQSFQKGISFRIGSAYHGIARLMTHGGEEVATHENRAPSSKLWAQLSAEQKAFAAMRKESFEEMKEAVEAGASVETAVHGNGATAFHCAAGAAHFEMMEWLARKGADLII